MYDVVFHWAIMYISLPVYMCMCVCVKLYMFKYIYITCGNVRVLGTSMSTHVHTHIDTHIHVPYSIMFMHGAGGMHMRMN